MVKAIIQKDRCSAKNGQTALDADKYISIFAFEWHELQLSRQRIVAVFVKN